MTDNYNLMSKRMHNKLLSLLREGKRPVIAGRISMTIGQINDVAKMLDPKKKDNILYISRMVGERRFLMMLDQ